MKKVVKAKSLREITSKINERTVLGHWETDLWEGKE